LSPITIVINSILHRLAVLREPLNTFVNLLFKTQPKNTISISLSLSLSLAEQIL